VGSSFCFVLVLGIKLMVLYMPGAIYNWVISPALRSLFLKTKIINNWLGKKILQQLLSKQTIERRNKAKLLSKYKKILLDRRQYHIFILVNTCLDSSPCSHFLNWVSNSMTSFQYMMVNFMCQLDWTIGWLDVWSSISLGVWLTFYSVDSKTRYLFQCTCTS
jgi:hypothetical protein